MFYHVYSFSGEALENIIDHRTNILLCDIARAGGTVSSDREGTACCPGMA